MQNQIKDLFGEYINLAIENADLLSKDLENATNSMVATLLDGNKIIVTGTGKNNFNAQIFYANLIYKFDLDRPSLPCVLMQENSLECDKNFQIIGNKILNNQLDTVAIENDLLVVFASYDCIKIENLLKSASAKNIKILLICASCCEKLIELMAQNTNNLSIIIKHQQQARILESHLFIANTLAKLTDTALFKPNL